MNIPELTTWIEHLSHPLVLCGFGMMVFSGAAIAFKKSRSRTVRLSLYLLFALAIGGEVIGALHVMSNTSRTEPGSSIHQTSIGNKSPGFINVETASVTYNKPDTLHHDRLPQEKNSDTAKTGSDKKERHTITQTSTGDKSPNFIGSKNARVSY